MRIVYVIEMISPRGGQERVIIDKMNYLAEHTSHEITLMTVWKDTRPAAFPLHKNIRRVTLDVHMLNISGGYAVSLPVVLYKFNSRIKEINPDITIFFRAMGAFLCATTSWTGKKIFESHTPYRFSNHKWLYPYMQRKADVVVCLTKGDAEEFNMAKCTKVIPNFTMISTSKVPDYGARNVVFVGRDCPEKDIPRLKHIWSIVHRNHPDWTLSVHHNTKDIVSAYLSGSILVMTSKAEGFGLVLLEAMCCGLPCIAFDCPHGPRDIIEDGKTGFLVQYDDNQEFIGKLSTLMDDENLRRQMGSAARIAAQRYQPESIMQQWLGLFAV